MPIPPPTCLIVQEIKRMGIELLAKDQVQAGPAGRRSVANATRSKSPPRCRAPEAALRWRRSCQRSEVTVTTRIGCLDPAVR